jgi:hypothetical protein
MINQKARHGLRRIQAVLAKDAQKPLTFGAIAI